MSHTETGTTEIAMHLIDDMMVVSITLDDERIPIGEMRRTISGPQFTTEGFNVWITPGILEGIARLLNEVDDSFNPTGVYH